MKINCHCCAGDPRGRAQRHGAQHDGGAAGARDTLQVRLGGRHPRQPEGRAGGADHIETGGIIGLDIFVVVSRVGAVVIER